MKVCVMSLGCKVNIYESEYVISLLKDNGFEIVNDDEKADIYIINTCSVTNESDRKSRKLIHHARRENKDAIIVVMGCYTQIKYKDIEMDADIVIGNKDKSLIVELINEYMKKKEKIERIYDLSKQEFEQMEIRHFENHTRAFVKIQDGCNAFCSYCIIPYTRGRIRSKKEDDVLREVSNLVKAGYKEIVLTGIHTGKYGMDIDTNLESLLRKLISISGLYRLRLSSIEINEITDGILDLMAHSDVIANHLHIPLQSGSDRILKLMNRRYDKSYFIKRVSEIRKIRPDISITTDLIVGFPGETEDDFNETLDTLREIGFTKIHTFPYSKRDNTKAALMKEQIPGDIKKRRVHEVLELSSLGEKKYYEQFIGQILEGVSEVRKDGRIVVHTSNFIPIVVDDKINNNEIVLVRLGRIEKEMGYGQVCEIIKV